MTYDELVKQVADELEDYRLCWDNRDPKREAIRIIELCRETTITDD